MKRTRTDGLTDGTETNDTNRQVPRRIRRIQTISLALLVVCGTIRRGAELLWLPRGSTGADRNWCDCPGHALFRARNCVPELLPLNSETRCDH
jgi:hypothetical protein